MFLLCSILRDRREVRTGPWFAYTWPFAHVGCGGVKNGGLNFGNRTVVKIITRQCAIIPTVPSLVCSLCIRQDKITRLLKCDIEGDFEANEERWAIEYRPAMNVALWYWYPYDLLQFIHAFLCNSNLYLAGPSHVQVGRWQLGFFAMEREHREVHCCIRARVNCPICKIICLFEVAQQIRLWPLLLLILMPIGECSSDGKALGRERTTHAGGDDWPIEWCTLLCDCYWDLPGIVATWVTHYRAWGIWETNQNKENAWGGSRNDHRGDTQGDRGPAWPVSLLSPTTMQMMGHLLGTVTSLSWMRWYNRCHSILWGSHIFRQMQGWWDWCQSNNASSSPWRWCFV